MENVEDTFFTKKTIIGGIFIGIIIALIANLTVTFGFTSFTSNYFFIQFTSALSTIGISIIGSFLILGGISNTSIDKFVRLGMVVAGGSLIAMALSAISSLSSLSSYYSHLF
jgi:hypothetical protein